MPQRCPNRQTKRNQLNKTQESKEQRNQLRTFVKIKIETIQKSKYAKEKLKSYIQYVLKVAIRNNKLQYVNTSGVGHHPKGAKKIRNQLNNAAYLLQLNEQTPEQKKAAIKKLDTALFMLANGCLMLDPLKGIKS